MMRKEWKAQRGRARQEMLLNPSYICFVFLVYIYIFLFTLLLHNWEGKATARIAPAEMGQPPAQARWALSKAGRAPSWHAHTNRAIPWIDNTSDKTSCT
jgi:hypothetical protein